MEIKIQIKGDILKKLKSASKDVRDIVVDGIRDASTLLMEDSIRNAPASTGNLRKSIRREIDERGLRATIFPSAKYGFFLHGPIDKSRERSKPFMIPAKEARAGGTLYRWAKKKGMNPWAVRASIAKKGIKFNPFLTKTAEADQGKVRDIFKRTLNQIAAHLAD